MAAAQPKTEQPKKPAGNEFAGMTFTRCALGCTPERCVISTVSICKHPYLAPPNGCGPVTLANRDRATKYLKRQKIDKG